MDTRQIQVKDLARHVGYVFQDPESMFATLYVADEIAFGPENLSVLPQEIKDRVDDLLDLTQLEEQRGRLVWALSGGQVQKLGLAAVLAMQPEMIVLDEPTSNLDPAATNAIHQLVLTLRQSGKTVLLVTRELDEFLAQADQLLVMQEGRMIASGAPKEVLLQHGKFMIETLGIWLPETAEIGVELHGRAEDAVPQIPITVDETVEILRHYRFHPPHECEPPSTVKISGGETVISAGNLSFAYPGGNYALRDVSFDIHLGEMTAIVGRNGAGKSTLAKLMTGLLKPQEGELHLFGKPAEKWNIQDLSNHIALVFQNPEHQFLTDTVLDEIEYSLLARGMQDPQEIEHNAEDMLSTLEMQGFEKTHPFALSAGCKRRLGVATMLVGKPQVLVVDEPTYGQDKHLTHILMALMKRIQAQGIGVVMITHDMHLVQEYTERAIVMSEGQILFDGTPQSLFEDSSILTAANLRPTILNQLSDRLRQEGIWHARAPRNTADFLACIDMKGER